MSTTAEDIRKIMNILPFASPFSETFDPSTDSLEAIRGAIDALEAGIFGYGVVAGAQIVEIDDKAEYAVELLNPGGAVIPAGSITPGTYTIHRIRDGTKTSIYTHAAAAADGRVELDTPYEYLIASWAPGDLFMVVFSGIYTTIGATLTYFPDMILSGRIARDEEIENILEYTTAATLKDAIEDDTDSIYNRLGDPTGRTNFKSLYAMLELDDTANYNLDDILRTGYATAGANLGTGSIMERIGTIANASHNRSVLEGMGLPDTDLTTLYELLVIGYTTAGANLGTGSIMERIGTIGNAAHNRSVLEGMGLPDTDLTTLYELMVTGFTTAGADLGTGSIMERIGTIANASHNRSVLEGMGLPDTDLTTLYELMVTGYVTEGAAVKAGSLIEKHNYMIDLVGDNTDSVLNRLGDPTGRTNFASLYLMLELDDTANYNLDDILRTGYATAGANLGTGSIMERIGTIANASHNRSVLEGMGLPDTDLTTLYELLVIGYTTAGADLGTGSIMERIGTIANASHNRSVLEGMGLPDTDLTTLYELMVTGYVTEGAAVKAGSLIEKHNYMIDLVGDNTDSVLNRIGAFDGGADPQGDIYQALGVPVTASIWDAVQYIEDVACPAAPVAGSLLQVLVEDIYERTLGEQTLNGLLGVPDVAAYSLWANIGSFQGRTVSADRTLMDVLGIPDDANGSLFDRLGAFTSVNNLKVILGAFDPADNLFATLGGYDADDSLKDHLDYVDVTAIPGAPLTKTMIYYLQAIGSNDADNDFASPLVVANPIGSVLERLQHLQEILDDEVTDANHDIEVADGVGEISIATFTPHRNGKAGIEFDLQELIAAAEGGTVTVRLKHMIDNTTARTIDKVDFVVGVDEVHQTLEGWLDSNNTNGAEITVQCSVAVTATRKIYYKIVEAA